MAALLLAPACTHTAAGPLPETIQTQTGLVRGVADGVGVRAFKGIPYAAPPTGDRRWRPPAPPAHWSEVRDAARFGPRCSQPASFGPGGGASTAEPMSEDCLTLNVWTPAQATGEHLPVMVWLHGGGFTIGSGSAPASDGANLARLGAVVVTINYRVGALGFFAHPQLSQESEHKTSGNYGLLDQIAALQWVRANIAAFGGDPTNVTLMGQSAGASSVSDLMVSPLARGLFHKGVVHSLGGSFMNQPTLAEAEREGAALAPDIAALRALSADEVVAKLPASATLRIKGHFYPVVDGYVLPGTPAAMFAAAKQAKIPLLVGNNGEEAVFWKRDFPTTVAGYRDLVAEWFRPAFTAEVLARYPAATDANVAKAATQLISAYRVVTPTALMARAASGASPVYMYRFSRASPFARANFGGAAHTTEIAYVFANIAVAPQQYEERDVALSQEMAAAWLRFAKIGNPNGAGRTQWPAYRAPGYRLMQFGDATSVGTNADDAEIEFFRLRPTGQDAR